MKSKLSRRQSREQAFLLAFERNINHEAFKDLYETAMEENPESVIINEAVIIAKKYSTPEETSFINGILGAVVRGQA